MTCARECHDPWAIKLRKHLDRYHAFLLYDAMCVISRVFIYRGIIILWWLWKGDGVLESGLIARFWLDGKGPGLPKSGNGFNLFIVPQRFTSGSLRMYDLKYDGHLVRLISTQDTSAGIHSSSRRNSTDTRAQRSFARHYVVYIIGGDDNIIVTLALFAQCFVALHSIVVRPSTQELYRRSRRQVGLVLQYLPSVKETRSWEARVVPHTTASCRTEDSPNSQDASTGTAPQSSLYRPSLAPLRTDPPGALRGPLRGAFR